MTNTSSKIVAGISPDTAIELLVKEYGPKLYSLGIKFCGNPDEAQDMVQEVFYNVYKSWHTFKGDSKVTTWLYTIASRVCQKMHSKRAGEPAHMLSLSSARDEASGQFLQIASDDQTPLEMQLKHETEQLIAQGITRLPEKYRMPIIMKDLAGLSIEDVSTVLNIPIATIKTHLHRGRKMIQDWLEQIHSATGEVDSDAWSICRDLYLIYHKAKALGIDISLPDFYCENCHELFQDTQDPNFAQNTDFPAFTEDVHNQVIRHAKNRK